MRRFTFSNLLAAALLAAALLAGGHGALAATLTVTTLDDAGRGSLRQCISDATSGDTIVFNPNLAQGVIKLTSGALGITKNLALDASAAAGGVIISGSNASRVLEVGSVTLAVTGLELRDGQNHWRMRGSSFFQEGGGIILNLGQLSLRRCTLRAGVSLRGGGAIENDGTLSMDESVCRENFALLDGGGINNNGTAQLTRCTFLENKARNGAAIINHGTLTARNCTFAGNTADNEGGGVENFGAFDINSSTMAGNAAHNAGGGLMNFQSATLENSIIAGNVCPDSSQDADISGRVNSQGHNLIGIADGASGSIVDRQQGDLAGSVTTPRDARLDTLRSNGGFVPTLALLPGSPALDAGDDNVLLAPLALTTDARGEGFSRRRNAHVDIGSYEWAPPLPTLTVANAVTVNEGSSAAPGQAKFRVTLSSAYDKTVKVNFQTVDGTALAGSDYLTVSGTLAFGAGTTLKIVTVKFIGDAIPEVTEKFFLDLKIPVNATLKISRASAYIRDDDSAAQNALRASH